MGGTVNLGEWNNGTTLYNLTNYGNDILNIQWNVSNATNDIDSWQPNGTDMYIDDDRSYIEELNGIKNLTMVALNFTKRTFEPSGGLGICIRQECDDGLNETLDTGYHILPPSGLQQGTYNSTIKIEIS